MDAKFIKLSTLVLASCFSQIVTAATTQLPNEPSLPEQGWQMLFDGDDLAGWQHVGKGQFLHYDHMLQSDGNMGVLWYSKQKFGNCVIRVIYKVNDPGSNSGVFVRIAHPPKDPWDVVNNAYEIQIKDTEDAYHRTGAVYSMTEAAKAPTHPVGEWNTMDIMLIGKNIYTYVNGKQVSQFIDGQTVPPKKVWSEPSRDNVRPVYGYIGIQNEDDQFDGKTTHVWYKQISVLPLDKTTLIES
jgi:hypothetical protein